MSLKFSIIPNTKLFGICQRLNFCLNRELRLSLLLSLVYGSYKYTQNRVTYLMRNLTAGAIICHPDFHSVGVPHLTLGKKCYLFFTSKHFYRWSLPMMNFYLNKTLRVLSMCRVTEIYRCRLTINRNNSQCLGLIESSSCGLLLQQLLAEFEWKDVSGGVWGTVWLTRSAFSG